MIGVERRALFLEIGAAEVGPQDSAARIQRNRGFDLAAPGHQIAFADQAETQAQVCQRIGRIQIQRPVERAFRAIGIDFAQGGIAQHHLGARQVRIQCHRPGGSVARFTAVPEGQLNLG